MLKILLFVFLSSQAFSQNVIVLNKSENTMMVFDVNGEIRATIATGLGPHEVAVSPNGRYAVVSNYGTRENPGNTISLYNLKSLKLEETINLGNYRRPHSLAWIDTSKIVTTVESNKAILIVDIRSGKVEREIKTEQDVSHMLVLSPDREKVYVANIGSGTVSVIDLVKGETIKNVYSGKGSEGIDITPDGREIWVTNRAEDSVTVIDAESFEIVKKIKVEGFPIRVKISKDGKLAVISCARAGEIAIVDVKNKRVEKRIKTAEKVKSEEGGRLFGSVFGDSPVPVGIALDERGYVYVANSNADVVSVIDLKKGVLVKTLKTGKEPDGIALF